MNFENIRSRKILRAQLRRADTDQRELIGVNWKLIAEGAEKSETWFYAIDLESLKARVKGLQKALNDLQNLYRTNISKSDWAPALIKLAEEGQALYETLMTGSSEKNGYIKNAVFFREWFEANVADAALGEYDIHFQLGVVKPLIPWGLTFTPRAGRSLNSLEGNYDEFKDFWCIRHNLMSYSDHSNRPKLEPKPMKGDDFTLTVVCEEEKGHSLWKLSLESLRSEEMPTSKEDLKNFVDTKTSFSQLMYFNPNPSSRFISVGSDELLPSELFEMFSQVGKRIERMKKRNGIKVTAGFAFVDQEAIFHGEQGEEWIDTFMGSQWGGVIAAEVSFSNQALRGFGVLLFNRIINAEEPASETISKIRKEFWPFSLLYGVYYNVEQLYLKPQPDFAKAVREISDQLPHLNFVKGKSDYAS